MRNAEAIRGDVMEELAWEPSLDAAAIGVAVLLRLAEATDHSVIALTTHGRGGFRRAVLGSVADKVVRASTRPVLLVRPVSRP